MPIEEEEVKSKDLKKRTKKSLAKNLACQNNKINPARMQINHEMPKS